MKSLKTLLPKRNPDSHKGDFGHVLVVAGSSAMTGAAYLCALGALRAGAGLVTVASAEKARAVIRNRLPEAMTIGFSQILPYIRKRRVTTLAIGPGLGIGKMQRALVLKLLGAGAHSGAPLRVVLDADGINNLNGIESVGAHRCAPNQSVPNPLILTPHEGELARLLNVSRETIHRHRKRFATQAAKAVGGICLLKGHRTLIADGQTVYENTTGTPALATGGTGDVLTGVIAGLLAQGLSPVNAARLGAWAHGRAAQRAAKGDRGLLAHEVADMIPSVLA